MKIKPVKEAKPNRQMVGKGEMVRPEMATSYMKGADQGYSDTPSYRAAVQANRSARPGPVPQYTGNKSAHKLRG